MPIESSAPITVNSQDEFHEIDHIMLGHAFAIHNEFGRLLDEVVYKNELAERCRAAGMQMQREVLVRVRHAHFTKDYFIDLLLCGSTVIEAKVAKSLSETHHGQCINYLLLTGTHHGSLVNFRPPKVVREFVSTTLTRAIRTTFDIHTHDWPSDGPCTQLRDTIQAFCADIGLGLDLSLYREAFAALAGLPSRHVVPLFSRGKQVGGQEMHLVSEDIGLAVTALPDTQNYRTHLERLLNMTELKSIAWANLRLRRAELICLRRQNHGG